MASSHTRFPDYDGLVKSIYASALNHELWPETLTQLRIYLRASAFSLFPLDFSAFDRPALFTENVPMEWAEDYRDYWHAHDIWIKTASTLGEIQPGNIVVGSQLVERRELIKSHWYNDALVSYDIRDALSCGLWGADSEMPPIALSFYRNLAGMDFREADQELLSKLIWHLTQSITISWRLGLLGSSGRLSESLFAGLIQPVFMLDSQRRILQVNPAGDELLRCQPELVKFGNGRILAIGERSSLNLDTAFAQAERGIIQPIAFVYFNPAKLAITGTVCILELGDHSSSMLAARAARYLLIIESGKPVCQHALGPFAKIFRLTRAEQAVLLHLVDGLAPGDIAATLGIGIPTVRSHIKNIYYKTGARRASQLIRMVVAATRLT